MNLPFFYTPHIPDGAINVELDEVNSRHAVQVLRMTEGEELLLTDGQGATYTAKIAEAHKKHCSAEITKQHGLSPRESEVAIAISLVKNSNRFEWFLEKATELGVSEIIPLICTRTEKQHFRFDRMNAILISAMLQSQQAWLPRLHEPVKFEKFVAQLPVDSSNKFIAHCEDTEKRSLRGEIIVPAQQELKSVMLIGPEGDFTTEEIGHALKNNFKPVSLGNTRLRTETAAVAAAVLLCIS